MTQRPLFAFLAGTALLATSACVPSIPPCNCANDGSTGGGAFPDESLLDRSADCILDETDACGYPAGEYGLAVGDVFPNFEVMNCDGEAVEFAEMLNVRPDTDTFNRGVVFAFGAGWCGPCQDESKHFGEIAPGYRDDDIQFLHMIIENQQDEPASTSLCQQWDEEISMGTYPIWFTDDLSLKLTILPPSTSIPYLFMIDANANIRFVAAGIQPDAVIESQIQMMINNPYG